MRKLAFLMVVILTLLLMFFNAPMMRDGSVATYLMYMAYTIGVQRSDG